MPLPFNWNVPSVSPRASISNVFFVVHRHVLDVDYFAARGLHKIDRVGEYGEIADAQENRI